MRLKQDISKPTLFATHIQRNDIVFLSESDAIDYDIDRYPELHQHKDGSLVRIQEVIEMQAFDKLTEAQKAYLLTE